MKKMQNKPTGLGSLPQSNIFSEVPDYTATLHRRENNPQSQAHLEENEQKFVGQCAIVLSLLQKGIVLSSYSAMTQYRIGHLPRRIKDLRDGGKVKNIEDQFEFDSTGKATRNKIWFIREALTDATAVKYKIEWKRKNNKQ